ncbi:MAG: hypothetical protein ACOVRE_01530 [Sediminibacterium sp.]|jgi:hypothetical protein|nr:hypothetical protein [Sediminibacterium sp.]
MTNNTFAFRDQAVNKDTAKYVLLEMLNHTVEFYKLNQFGDQIRNDKSIVNYESKIAELMNTINDVQTYLDKEKERDFNISVQISID